MTPASSRLLLLGALALLVASACLQFDDDGRFRCESADAAGCPAPGGGDGGAADGGEGSGDGGLPDGGLPDGGSMARAAEQFCQEMGAVYCERIIHCGGLDESNREGCEKYLATNFLGTPCSVSARAVALGHRTFDPEAASECLSSLAVPDGADAGSVCQSFLSEACGTIFKPNAGRGQTCTVHEDCLGEEDVCVGEESCGRTCQRAGAPGMPCVRSDRSCDEGAFCDNQTSLCRARLALGEACEWNEQCAGEDTWCRTACEADGGDCASTCAELPKSGEPCRTNGWPYCASGYHCDYWASTPVCKAQVGVGEPCNLTEACGRNLADGGVGPEAYCAWDGFGSTCQPRKPLESACSHPEECVSPLACISGTCSPARTLGESCTQWTECESQRCDDYRRVCIPNTSQSVDAGEPCSPSTDYCIGRGYECKGAEVNPDGGVGTLGTCSPVVAGDPCYSHWDCPSAHYCNRGEGQEQGTCQPAGPATPCDYEDQCLEDSFCSSNGTCAPRRTEGQGCTASEWNECAPPTLCRLAEASASVGTCGAPSGEGEGCVRQDDCSGMLVCEGGTCVVAGSPGQRCLQGSFCWEGSCQEDGDGGRVCAPALEEGEACYLSSECASSLCEGVCLAACGG